MKGQEEEGKRKEKKTHNRHTSNKTRRRQNTRRSTPIQLRLDDARDRGPHEGPARVCKDEEAKGL